MLKANADPYAADDSPSYVMLLLFFKLSYFAVIIWCKFLFIILVMFFEREWRGSY